MKITKSIYIKSSDKNYIIDLRTKTYSLDNISKNDDDNLSLALQPALKTEFDLETNMFSPYPQSNIPFSYSTSWIGM